eukprot:1597821-Rhodomonas_salina.1
MQQRSTGSGIEQSVNPPPALAPRTRPASGFLDGKRQRGANGGGATSTRFLRAPRYPVHATDIADGATRWAATTPPTTASRSVPLLSYAVAERHGPVLTWLMLLPGVQLRATHEKRQVTARVAPRSVILRRVRYCHSGPELSTVLTHGMVLLVVMERRMTDSSQWGSISPVVLCKLCDFWY